MASPQTEDGYTEIANELLEAIIKTPMSDYEHRVFWLIVRKTYGYKKKSDWISQKQIVEYTGILKQHVSRTINKLYKKNMIIKEGKNLAVQKDYEQWKLPKRVTKKSNQNRLQKLPKQVTEVTQTGYESNLNRGTQNKILQNKIIQNKYIYISPKKKPKKKKNEEEEKLIKEVFDYWNKKEIIIHKKLDDATKSKIEAKLKDYSRDEILGAINNYAFILHNPKDYWFNYKWTLKDFLQRGLEKFKDWEVASENYLRKDKLK